jgi:hypothetical protein
MILNELPGVATTIWARVPEVLGLDLNTFRDNNLDCFIRKMISQTRSSVKTNLPTFLHYLTTK